MHQLKDSSIESFAVRLKIYFSIKSVEMKLKECIYRVNQKKVQAFGGYGMKSMRAIFKTNMLTYQSKANLDEKILFGKITHHSSLRGECPSG